MLGDRHEQVALRQPQSKRLAESRSHYFARSWKNRATALASSTLMPYQP